VGRTGLILRQWTERDGCVVTVYQAESYETPRVMTSVTDKVKVFVFENEWRAKLCHHRMSYSKYEHREKYWLRYFRHHVNPPTVEPNFNVWGLLHPDIVFTVLVIVIVLAVYLCEGL